MAYRAQTVHVATTGTLIWRTSTAVTPTPPITRTNRIFEAHGVGDPLPVLVVIPQTVVVYVVNASGAAHTTGFALPKGPYAMPFNVIGNDALYMAVASTTSALGVIVGRGA
jgi:hypothetical protein